MFTKLSYSYLEYEFLNLNGVKSYIADKGDWQSSLACATWAVSTSWIDSCLN